MRQLALLRGVNVGGKNSVPMKQLAALFAAAGCQNISTYIQSGNVVFDYLTEASEDLAQQLSAAIESEFSCRVPIVMRTVDQLAKVLNSNPFLQEDLQTPEEMLHVYFLAKEPSAEQVLHLDTSRSVPDRFIVSGREIYLRLPDGMARTKLTNAYFDSRLATTCTARNWRTIQKLCELMS